MKKICDLYKKYEELIVYVIVGGLTTVVNFVVYYFAKLALGEGSAFSMNVAIAIAWTVAVIFAFVANKFVVFKSKETNSSVLLKEFWQFILARVFSLAAEYLIMNVGVEVLHINDLICKMIAQVVIVIMNYFFSKFIIFNKK